MSDADIKSQCSRCLGTGSEESGTPPIPQVCTGCGGSGYREKDKIDTTEIVAKEEATNANVDEVEVKIDALTEKCDDIWDKLKKTKEKCDDIWDKVKDM